MELSEDLKNLIANDPTDNNSYAGAINTLINKINELEIASENATNIINEKDNAIKDLKSKNYELLVNTGVSKNEPIKAPENLESVLEEIAARK